MFSELVSNYLNYLEVEKALSKNTVQAYLRDIFDFIEYIENEGIHSPCEIKRINLSQYNRNLAKKGLSPTSIVRKIASIKGFFRYLSYQEQLSKNPALSLSSPT